MNSCLTSKLPNSVGSRPRLKSCLVLPSCLFVLGSAAFGALPVAAVAQPSIQILAGADRQSLPHASFAAPLAALVVDSPLSITLSRMPVDFASSREMDSDAPSLITESPGRPAVMATGHVSGSTAVAVHLALHPAVSPGSTALKVPEPIYQAAPVHEAAPFHPDAPIRNPASKGSAEVRPALIDHPSVILLRQPAFLAGLRGESGIFVQEAIWQPAPVGTAPLWHLEVRSAVPPGNPTVSPLQRETLAQSAALPAFAFRTSPPEAAVKPALLEPLPASQRLPATFGFVVRSSFNPPGTN